MIIHFIIYNTKTGNFETNPNLYDQRNMNPDNKNVLYSANNNAGV